ncbi:LysR family transcriptional regulator [Rhizobium sp. S95]|uniref:LysR family transcriptional regulator n=1 Tax=Ciceribacter sichuanensis TaxID=2949647 RepID=A0AAJ1F682_9HYPH|nr:MULTISPECIES: LysR family transcriptional regulator [unclassified Ciceribacter]MCM2394653.1 LysR family transcriptional regulator [Ciceribacter sp. S95]MCO5958640.1 LysR family transcriptional regulator [Ciceribacter sp. S101]
MRRFDHLGDVEAFITVIDKGSISAGAVALSTTPSVLSRAITRLEARLGTQLVRRTTRRLSLTEAGRAYLEQARAAFSMIDDAERAIQGRDGTLGGRIRISVSTTYGHFRLPEKLARFTAAHPDVQVEVSITNRNVDLVAEGFDIAIRLGPLPDSGLVGRKLEDAPLRLVASPAYLERAGMPRSIGDLARHTCLPFIMPSTGRPSDWLFSVDGEEVNWMPQGSLHVFDDVLGVVSLAEAGIGICQTYDFIIRDRIARGSLVEILPEASGRTRPFSVLYVPHRSLSTATRAFIDMLVE